MLGIELARRLRATRPSDELAAARRAGRARPARRPRRRARCCAATSATRRCCARRSTAPRSRSSTSPRSSAAARSATSTLALDVNLDGGRALVAGLPRARHGAATRVHELAGDVRRRARARDRRRRHAADAVDHLRRDQGDARAAVRGRDAQGLPRRPLGAAADGDRAARARPNAAASSFASAVVREPLAGRPATLPVSLDLPAVVIGVDTTVGLPGAAARDRRRRARQRPGAQPPGPRRHLAASCSMRCTRSSIPRRSRRSRSRSIPPSSASCARWADRLELVARRRHRPAARRGRRGHRARLPRAHRAVSAEREAALDACARQDGAELVIPFGPQIAVFKIAGKIFAIVGLERLAAADHAQVRPRARRGAARRARGDRPRLPHEQAPLDHGDARRQPRRRR